VLGGERCSKSKRCQIRKNIEGRCGNIRTGFMSKYLKAVIEIAM
jgi:hypothetical protein